MKYFGGDAADQITGKGMIAQLDREAAASGLPDSPSMRRVCIFGGSRPGVRPGHAAVARARRGHGSRGMGLVYGRTAWV